MADPSSFDSAKLIPPRSQSTPQPKRISLPASSATMWLQCDNVAAKGSGVEIAGAMPVPNPKAEGVVDGFLLRCVLRRHQQLHRVRQMAGVTMPHETDIGLRFERRFEKPIVESCGLGGVDAVLAGPRVIPASELVATVTEMKSKMRFMICSGNAG
jgi:hypothetical protein